MKKPTLSAVGELLGIARDRLRLRLPDDPVKPSWLEIIDRNVPLSHRLDAAGRERLIRITQLFVQEVPFEGCAGLDVSEEIQITIAATASLLLLGLPYPRFTKVVRVLVYPTAFVPKTADDFLGVKDEPDRPGASGQAWIKGIVVLSWDDIMRHAASPEAGHNVVLHEFAHMLDAEDGKMNGIPLHDDPAQAAGWEQVLNSTFATATDDDFPLDPYAAKSESELFAVSTEEFFSLPAYMRGRLPAWYDQLSKFYGQNPIAWL